MSDKFYNLSVDVRGSMQVDEILESEEAYYLRRINGRSNAKLLLRVAQEFNLKIPTMSDPCGYDTCRMAACTTETYINDMIRYFALLYMALFYFKLTQKTARETGASVSSASVLTPPGWRMASCAACILVLPLSIPNHKHKRN